MAHVRKADRAQLPPGDGGHGSVNSGLSQLLSARRFRLGANAERVAQNLSAFGGEVSADATAIIGSGRPPADVPSVSLGAHSGTLGPRSFGFLSNVTRIAALNAPIPAMPRRGSLALIVPARDALPDVVPLVLERGLGISWIISVGDGDLADAVAFVSADAATTKLAIALGPGADGATLRQVLGAKPAVLLGTDPLCCAVARRVGAQVVDRLDTFLAHAALLDAEVEPGGKVLVAVLGGGERLVRDQIARVRLDAELVAIDDGDADALEALSARAAAESLPLLLVLGGPPVLPTEREGVRLLGADLRHPEHLAALFEALAQKPAAIAPPVRVKANVDQQLVERVRAEAESTMSDHDAKRLLKAHGVRVSRQAPTSTPTGAINLARQIGLPVTLVKGAEARSADKLPDVRRIAALFLESDRSDASGPSVMVREHFPEVPRSRARIVFEKGIGHAMRIGDVCALLPLTELDAEVLAQATAARRAQEKRGVAELLLKISACAVAENALFDLELFVGNEAAVVNASGTLRR